MKKRSWVFLAVLMILSSGCQMPASPAATGPSTSPPSETPVEPVVVPPTQTPAPANTDTPVEPATPSLRAAQISAGSWTLCMVTTEGGAVCLQERYPSVFYTFPAGLSGKTTQISVTYDHSCALQEDGSVACWENGLRDAVNRPPAQSVAGLSGSFVQIYAEPLNNRHCALSSGGSVFCWDWDDVAGENNVPVEFAVFSGIGRDVTSVMGDLCVIMHDNPLQCWRSGPQKPPQAMPGFTQTTDMAGGRFHACELTTKGGVLCFGENYYGTLGAGQAPEENRDSNKRVPVEGLGSGVGMISSADKYVCALTAEGAVKCWGDISGLGEATPTIHYAPVEVPGLSSGIIQIASGNDFSCALLADGLVKCWGFSLYIDYGRNGPTDILPPQ